MSFLKFVGNRKLKYFTLLTFLHMHMYGLQYVAASTIVILLLFVAAVLAIMLMLQVSVSLSIRSEKIILVLKCKIMFLISTLNYNLLNGIVFKNYYVCYPTKPYLYNSVTKLRPQCI